MAKWIVYSGPILAFTLFSWYHEEIYTFLEGLNEGDERYMDVLMYEEGLGQQIAKGMIYLHFGKMLLETMFLHRMAGRMTPLNRTLW